MPKEYGNHVPTVRQNRGQDSGFMTAQVGLIAVSHTASPRMHWSRACLQGHKILHESRFLETRGVRTWPELMH